MGSEDIYGALTARGLGKGRVAKEQMLRRQRTSRTNPLLYDLRTVVAEARKVGMVDVYQKALVRINRKRDYDGGYVALSWEPVRDKTVVDFGHRVLTRLANLERMG
jgi:hypothetical protein